MFDDIVENASFIVQIGSFLTYIHKGSFVMQKLSKEQKEAFVQSVQTKVDPDYE